jgi:hypothetical protein
LVALVAVARSADDSWRNPTASATLHCQQILAPSQLPFATAAQQTSWFFKELTRKLVWNSWCPKSRRNTVVQISRRLGGRYE